MSSTTSAADISSCSSIDTALASLGRRPGAATAWQMADPYSGGEPGPGEMREMRRGARAGCGLLRALRNPHAACAADGAPGDPRRAAVLRVGRAHGHRLHL